MEPVRWSGDLQKTVIALDDAHLDPILTVHPYGRQVPGQPRKHRLWLSWKVGGAGRRDVSGRSVEELDRAARYLLGEKLR